MMEYMDEDLGNEVKLEMLEIPSGSFLMGQNAAEKQELIQERGEEHYQQFRANELPQHLVNITKFYMGKYPITQSQYLAMMDHNPSCFKGAQLPVEQVVWNNAQAFCQRLSKHSGKQYQLPSEAQWEYACRAGTTTPFYFGDTITPDLVNYGVNPSQASNPRQVKYAKETTPVGSFPPNAFGLYDMHGNVAEWCFDEWADSYDDAPIDGSAVGNISARNDLTYDLNGDLCEWFLLDEGTGIYDETPHTASGIRYIDEKNKRKNRVLRGGSWESGVYDCRSAGRLYCSASSHENWMGFRVVFIP
jgi:formylglycine-generating enzyme required for sulfatase activity